MSDEILIKMAGDIGTIKGLLESHVEQFKAHVADDDADRTRLTALEAAHNEARGANRVWNFVSGAVGAAVSVAANFVISGHRNHP